MTITLRGAFIGTLTFAVFICVYLFWLWGAEHQVRLHTQNLFRAIDNRNWEAVAHFVGDDYQDQWGDDKARLLERMREGLPWVRGSRIVTSNPAVRVEIPRAIWTGRIAVYSTDDGVMDMLNARINNLPTPFQLEWHRLSEKAWDWKLVRVSNASFEIPADMY